MYTSSSVGGRPTEVRGLNQSRAPHHTHTLAHAQIWPQAPTRCRNHLGHPTPLEHPPPPSARTSSTATGPVASLQTRPPRATTCPTASDATGLASPRVTRLLLAPLVLSTCHTASACAAHHPSSSVSASSVPTDGPPPSVLGVASALGVAHPRPVIASSLPLPAGSVFSVDDEVPPPSLPKFIGMKLVDYGFVCNLLENQFWMKQSRFSWFNLSRVICCNW
jgi:hypothetical protein